MTTLDHVSDTAFLVAQCRALESARPDALFHDPLAAKLAGDKGRAILDAFPTRAMTTWMVAVRTVVIDDLLREAISRGVQTIVNLGAGLDTRPYRLSLPSHLHWIEVDYPHVIAFKQERLAEHTPRCQLEQRALDLADLAARRSFFAELAARGTRTLVLTEGVVPYLDVEAVSLLADDLHVLPNLEGWIVDYVSPQALAYRKRAGLDQHMRATPFKFQPQDWFSFFAGHAWDVREIHYLNEVGVKLGRQAPFPALARWLFRLFGSMPKGKSGQRFAGYALLQPRAQAAAGGKAT